MIRIPRVRYAPGPLVSLSSLLLVSALAAGVLGSDVTADQPDVPGIQHAIERAQSVVVATPRTVQSQWTENEYGDRIIESEVFLEVSETLKGRADLSRLLRVEGGSVDGITLEVSGEPQVKVGERAVFMLESHGGNVDRVVGSHANMLRLDDGDVVRGTSIRLADIRAHARGARR